LKVSGNSKLEELDQFLRDIWLECCGHMSAFSYRRNELKMGRKLKDVLRACGKTLVVQICTECQWDGSGWLCEACAKKHECGEEMMLPVVNSPRTGVCGYSG